MERVFIKTVHDGRKVEVVGGFVCLGDEIKSCDVVDINPYLGLGGGWKKLADTVKKNPELTHMAGPILLTKEQAGKAMAAIEAQKAESGRVEKEKRQAWEEPLQKYRVLMRSGAFLADQKICTVCLLPEEDQQKYAEWCRGRVVCVSSIGSRKGVECRDSATAQAIMESSGKEALYTLASLESRMWFVTPEEEAAILVECAEKAWQRDVAEQAKEQEEKSRVAAIFAKAKAENKPQELERWITEECIENLDECSFDSAVEFAMPDGTRSIQYSHCF